MMYMLLGRCSVGNMQEEYCADAMCACDDTEVAGVMCVLANVAINMVFVTCDWYLYYAAGCAAALWQHVWRPPCGCCCLHGGLLCVVECHAGSWT
jgi:hypothetical protein